MDMIYIIIRCSILLVLYIPWEVLRVPEANYLSESHKENQHNKESPVLVQYDSRPRQWVTSSQIRQQVDIGILEASFKVDFGDLVNENIKSELIRLGSEDKRPTATANSFPGTQR